MNRKYIITFIIVLTLVYCGYIFFAHPYYDLDNFRYIFSALIQSLATIFALLVTSTIILFQFTEMSSPSSLPYFPKKELFYTNLFILCTLVTNSYILINLEEIASLFSIRIYYFSFFMNFISMVIICYFLYSAMNWFLPQTIINTLLGKAKETESNEQRNDIVLSFEELAIKAIKNSHIKNIKLIMNSYISLLEIFSEYKPELNKGQIMYDHPFGMITDSVTRLALFMNQTTLNNLTSLHAKILQKLIYIFDEKIENKFMTLYFITSSMEKIISDCKEKNLKHSAEIFATEITYGYNNVTDNLLSIYKENIELGIKYKMISITYYSLDFFFSTLQHLIGKDNDTDKLFKEFGPKIIDILNNNPEYLNQKHPIFGDDSTTIKEIIEDIKIILEIGETVIIEQKPHGNSITNPTYYGKLNTSIIPPYDWSKEDLS